MFIYRRLRIKNKLLLFVLPLIVILIIAVGYVSSSIAKKTLQITIAENLGNIANLKVSKLEDFYKKTYENIAFLQKDEFLKEKLEYIVKNDDSSLEDDLTSLNKHVSSFVKTYNYESIKLLNSSGVVVYNSDDNGLIGNKIGDPKDETFINGQKTIFFSRIFKQNKSIKIVVSAPVFSKNELIGIIAMELDMSRIYSVIQDNTGLGETGETLLGRKVKTGALFLNPLKYDNSAALNKEAKDGSVNATPVLNAVNGKASMGVFNDYRGDEVIAVSRYVPSFKWGLVAKMDTEEAFKSIDKIQQYILLVSVIMLIIAFLLSFSFAKSIVNPITQLKDSIMTLGDGNVIINELEKQGEDEIGEMFDATNRLSQIQKNIISFAQNIGEGQFDKGTNMDSIKGDLGSSLTNMSNNLQEVAKSDKKRNWTTVGLAKFAEILRARDEKIEDLTDTIIANLIKYLDANQGSIFVVNDDDKNSCLDLTASYAWNRKKHHKKQILLGEGLVGRCWQEGEKIYLTDIPDNYINITSGLGEASPKSILIIPMKIEEKVFGIIEIASFNEIEAYQVEFIEKIAESIATTISNTKTNLRTAYLLEESKEMTEEMRAQEEEMRQNMEEMQATQESLEVKQKELEASQEKSDSIFENSLDAILVCYEDGIINSMNQGGRNLFELEDDSELVNLNINELIPKFNPASPASFLNRRRRTKVVTLKQNRVNVEVHITQENIGGVVSFLGYIRDITKEIDKEQQIAENLMAMEELKSELKKIKS